MNKELNAGTEVDNGIKPIVLPSASLAQNPVLAAGFSNEKLNTIAELLSQAAMAVNAVECELHGTELKYELLVPNKNESTLWTQLYSLEKMFLSACR